MSTKSKTGIKYLDLISKSDSQVQAEQLESTVQQAENEFSMGLLSVKSMVISAQGEVKKHEIALANANKNLENAFSANPLKVQTILDKRAAVLQAEINLKAQEDYFKEVQDTLTYLEGKKSELF